MQSCNQLLSACVVLHVVQSAGWLAAVELEQLVMLSGMGRMVVHVGHVNTSSESLVWRTGAL